jgi:hypothetical protein
MLLIVGVHNGNGAHRLGGNWVIFLVEGELVGRPLQPWVVGAWLCHRDLTRQLLEVEIR